jgi:hypothetical protein
MSEAEEVDAFYGFQYKNRFYVVLSQDGLPSRLGLKLVDEIVKAYKSKKLDQWLQQLRESKIVYDDSIPTKEDLSQFKSLILKHHDKNNWMFLDDYYIHHQSLEKITTLGVILNSISPQGNPYVAPYGYVFNFDNLTLDIYTEHRRIESLEDRFGTKIPLLKEKIQLKNLSRKTFERVIERYEKGIQSVSCSSSEDDSDTDLGKLTSDEEELSQKEIESEEDEE